MHGISHRPLMQQPKEVAVDAGDWRVQVQLSVGTLKQMLFDSKNGASKDDPRTQPDFGNRNTIWTAGTLNAGIRQKWADFQSQEGFQKLLGAQTTPIEARIVCAANRWKSDEKKVIKFAAKCTVQRSAVPTTARVVSSLPGSDQEAVVAQVGDCVKGLVLKLFDNGRELTDAEMAGLTLDGLNSLKWKTNFGADGPQEMWKLPTLIVDTRPAETTRHKGHATLKNGTKVPVSLKLVARAGAVSRFRVEVSEDIKVSCCSPGECNNTQV